MVCSSQSKSHPSLILNVEGPESAMLVACVVEGGRERGEGRERERERERGGGKGGKERCMRCDSVDVWRNFLTSCSFNTTLCIRDTVWIGTP